MRLIDADALIEVLEKCKSDYTHFRCNYGNINIYDAIYIAEQYIKCIPPIKAEPVKHGYWIENKGGTGISCSECGKRRRYRDNDDRYCPRCGACMDGKEQSDEELLKSLDDGYLVV